MIRKRAGLAAVIIAVSIASASCGIKQTDVTEAEVSEQMSGKETVSAVNVVTEDMEPVYGEDLKDGIYVIQVDSSSSMFKIKECTLTVENGSMKALMTMGGNGYLKLFMGTGEEAVKAEEGAYIPFVETADGTYTFEVPVAYLSISVA